MKMNKCKIGIMLFACFIAIGISKANAQVGMMSNNPNKSAALDIEDTNKGVLISTVNLSSTTDTTGIAGGDPANSLLIFNNNSGIAGVGAGGTGYYYWDATLGRWKKLAGVSDMATGAWDTNGNSGTSQNVNFIGTTNNNDLVVKTNNIERMRITTSGDVGVGTSTPSYKMEANGNVKTSDKLYVQNVNVAPALGASQLVRNPNTGQVYALTTGEGTKPYNYVKYTLSNVNQDYVQSFNTKIPSDRYSVVVVGNAFKTVGTNVGMKASSGLARRFNPQNVYAYVSAGLWYLSADYDGGAPVSGNGSWEIYCLVINNAALATLSNQSANLGGTINGAMGAAPAGL